MNIVLKIRTKKKSLCKTLGIKNSWKYEKDLIIIFNTFRILKTIAESGHFRVGVNI